MADIIPAQDDFWKRVKEATNDVWTDYGWITIASGLIFGIAFIAVVLKRAQKKR